MNKSTTELHKSVSNQVSYMRHLAENHRKSADILESIADTAMRMNCVTGSMRRIVTIQADALKFAISATTQEEK